MDVMAVANEVQELFRAEPERALEFVRRGLGGRQRRVVKMLEALLEETDRLSALDGPRAISTAETALVLTCSGTESPALFARACGVLGSAYGVGRRCEEALRLFRRARRLPELPEEERGGVLAREAAVSCYLLRWQRAVRCANGAVRIFYRVKPARTTDSCSLSMALAVRSHVSIQTYLNAPEITPDLMPALKDCLRIFKEIEAHPQLRRSALVAVHNAGCVVATYSFSGHALPITVVRAAYKKTKAVQRQFLDMGMTRSSIHWAKSLWVEGLLDAKLAGSLTVSAERQLRKSRAILEEANSRSDAVALTLDLQWWLLAEGSLGRAIQECQYLEASLGEMGQYRPALEAWIEGLRRREYDAVLREVFLQVRRIRSVRQPAAARSTLPAWNPWDGEPLLRG